MLFRHGVFLPEVITDQRARAVLQTAVESATEPIRASDILIAALQSEDADTIEDVYEPYLMQMGFLTRTPRGRCVTRKAYEHLHLPLPDAINNGGMEQISL